MAIPPAHALAVRLPGDLHPSAIWAIWVIAKADFLKMLDAGFVVWEASENL